MCDPIATPKREKALKRGMNRMSKKEQNADKKVRIIEADSESGINSVLI